MKGSLSINNPSSSPMRYNASQYSRCFIPATTKLRNKLPSIDNSSSTPMRNNTSQYSSCFISATTKLWNEIPSMTRDCEATEI